MIDTILSNWNTFDSTYKLDIPFSVLLPAKMPLKATNLSIGDTAVHTLITGMTRSGKSTLLHMLIMSIVTKYDPDDVEIWLVDYGINEFKTYAYNRPPHVRFLALEKTQDFTFSFLDYLDKIRKERENLFRGELGVASLKDYRKKHGKHSLPRIVVLMDEFHVLTQHIETQDKYRKILENALTEGAKYGFSFIFANQTMSGLRGLTQTARDQIGVRIALKNTLSELYSTLDLTKTERVEAFANKAEKGEFLFRDSNHEIREAKGIYISEDTRRNILKSIESKNVHPRIDAEVFVLNGEERLPLPVRDIERKIIAHNGSTAKIYLGTPCSIEKECFIELKPKYDENLLVVGKDAMIPDIFINIIYSLTVNPANQIVIIVDPYDESLAKYKKANENLFGDRLRIVDDYEEICVFANTLKDDMRTSKMRSNNMFIFWIGMRDIFTEISHYPERKSNAQKSSSGISFKAEDIDAVENDTTASENSVAATEGKGIYIDKDELSNNAKFMASINKSGITLDGFCDSSLGFSAANDIVKANFANASMNTASDDFENWDDDSLAYNACEDIAKIVAMGSKQRIHSFIQTDSYATFKMYEAYVKKSNLTHVITTEITQEERMRWDLPKSLTVLQTGISAQYIFGSEIKTFKPFSVEDKCLDIPKDKSWEF